MHHQLLVLAVICIIPVAYTDTDPNYRLNTPVVPSDYQLRITPYFDTNDEKAFKFDGEVTIQLTTTANTNQIKLHSEDLNFSSANITVTNVDTNSDIPLNIANPLEFSTEYSFAYINLQTELVPGVQYAVRIIYTGPLREDLSGFYRNCYLENGVKKWLGATQMEPTHARKAFPCFDEPALRATFTIQLDRPSNYKNSLSNMRMQSSTDLGNGYIRETFYTTPKMSTYLIGFMVSEFEAGQYRNGSQEFGVYTRPEAKNQTSYTFDVGIKIVNDLGNYFGIDYYSMSENLKLDHIAIPDFKGGAMENWGIIKYRESALLFDPENSGPYYKYRVAQIVAHETTHMWFGDLVTCHWWSDSWLKEGFANYFQDYIIAFIEPELGSANLLVTNSVYTAYDSDDNPSAAPITNNDVNSPAEISAHFGRITYQKAGTVIRMIHHLVGEDAFKLGVYTYLTNNAYGSGTPSLLYAALDYGVTTYNSLSLYPYETVADLMDSWVSRAGHPVLHVSINYNTGAVTLTQKRFYIDASQSSNETYKIPITYTTGTSPDFTNTKPVFIMNDNTYEFAISNISESDTWVIFNIQETGFYRVNYDEQSWQIIASALAEIDYKTIHHLNRAKVVNDLFAFLYADEVSFAILKDVLKFLAHEDEYSVWFAALRGFNKLRNSYLGHPDTLNEIDVYAIGLVNTYIERFGFQERPTDSFEDLRNRQQILEFACKLDHNECIANALTMFKSLKEDGIEVSSSLRPVVYATGLRYGAAEEYDFLWHRMTTTNLANEVTIIIEALSHTSDEEKLKSYLMSMTVENSPVKTQDLTVPLNSVLSNYSNLHVVVDRLKNDYTLWTSIYTTMDSVLSSVASSLRTESDFNEFEAFLGNCTECTEAAKTTARNSLEAAKRSKAWADRHEAAILSTLQTSNSNTALPSISMIIIILTVFFLGH